jgi:hypothetical protein
MRQHAQHELNVQSTPLLFLVRRFEQFPNRDAQCGGNQYDVDQAVIARGERSPSNVGSVQTNVIRQLFLRPVAVATNLPHSASKAQPDMLFVFRERIVS